MACGALGATWRDVGLFGDDLGVSWVCLGSVSGCSFSLTWRKDAPRWRQDAPRSTQNRYLEAASKRFWKLLGAVSAEIAESERRTRVQRFGPIFVVWGVWLEPMLGDVGHDFNNLNDLRHLVATCLPTSCRKDAKDEPR